MEFWEKLFGKSNPEPSFNLSISCSGGFTYKNQSLSIVCAKLNSGSIRVGQTVVLVIPGQQKLSTIKTIYCQPPNTNFNKSSEVILANKNNDETKYWIVLDVNEKDFNDFVKKYEVAIYPQGIKTKHPDADNLSVLAKSENYDLMKELIVLGKGIDLVDESGRTALIHVTEKGHIEMVETLIRNNAQVNLKDVQGNTSLYLAAKGGHYEIVKLLLENGADVNQRAYYGNTALSAFESDEHLEIVKLLLEFGAFLDNQNDFGSTALMIAAFDGYKAIVKLLLDAGADTNILDSQSADVWDYARSNGHSELVEALAGSELLKEREKRDKDLSRIYNGDNLLLARFIQRGIDDPKFRERIKKFKSRQRKMEYILSEGYRFEPKALENVAYDLMRRAKAGDKKIYFWWWDDGHGHKNPWSGSYYDDSYYKDQK